MRSTVGEAVGLAAALTSSTLGGLSVAMTRFVVQATDPVTLGAFRFGIGFLALLSLLPITSSRETRRGDVWAVLALGSMFFCLLPVLFNSALIFTTAARGALAMATAPLLTMVIGALVGTESLKLIKFLGVVIAGAGVTVALPAGPSDALALAWVGNLLMFSAALCMAVYSALSAPVIRRVGALRFTTAAMGIGALELGALAFLLGKPNVVFEFSHLEWLSIAYLGLFGGALSSLLWVFALDRVPPTVVAMSVSIHPITAAVFAAAFMKEAIDANLLLGIAAVALGILLAIRTPGDTPRPEHPKIG